MKRTEPKREPAPSREELDLADSYLTDPPPIPFAEPWEYELRFPRDPRGPVVVRTTLKAVLGAHGLEEFRDRAELLASELTTNAVRYTQGPASVRMYWANPVLRVSVLDDSPVLAVPSAPAGPDAEGGQGLLILDLLADAWGECPVVESLSGACGKYVWFELVLGGGVPRGTGGAGPVPPGATGLAA